MPAYNTENQHFTTVKDSENPCRAYDILHGLLSVSFPCREPTTCYAVVWTASEARLRKERREGALAASLTVLILFFLIVFTI
jgi:hypothetical protein